MTEKSGIKLPIDDALLKRLESCTNLPSPPVVAMKIVEVAEDRNNNIGMVAEVISMDPALSAKIMRISNSPIYALRRKTENLHQAISLLGVNGTLTLALSFSLAASMNNNACDGFNFNAFWRRSLAAATCCRRIGMAINLRKGENLFLAGLLQDIGMLVIDKIEPEFYKKLSACQNDHRLLAAAEYEELGADHAAIGGWVMQKWGMPDYLVESVMDSHATEMMPGECIDQLFIDCISLSGPLVDAIHEQDESHNLQEVAEVFKARMQMDCEQFERMMESLNVDFRESEDLFETDLSDYGFSDELLDRAKEALIIKNLEAIQNNDKLQETADMLLTKTQLLEEKTRRDGLTGAYNRAYLDEKIQSEFDMARERGWPMIVMFVDLDKFKDVNDTYGHQAGDQVLQNAAKALQDGTREEDTVARYGGEEFVVIFPGQEEDTARVIAERLINQFRNLVHVVPGGKTISVTTSIGVSVLGMSNDFPNVDAMIEAADKALYAAKESGRDRFVVYSSRLESMLALADNAPPAA